MKRLHLLPIMMITIIEIGPRSVVDSTRDSGSLRVGSNPVEGVYVKRDCVYDTQSLFCAKMIKFFNTYNIFIISSDLYNEGVVPLSWLPNSQ